MSSSDRSSSRVRALGSIGLTFAAFCAAAAARADVDLATLQVTPERGQSADQARRDRYECHNWAVEQSGVVPRERPSRDDKSDSDRAKRAERVARAIAGAALGGALGGIIGTTRDRHHRNADDAVLAGAAVGAAVGAATAKGPDDSGKPSPSLDEDYLRALSACLEGRGYTVALPSR